LMVNESTAAHSALLRSYSNQALRSRFLANMERR
jgi:hypothetical protein